MPNVSRPSGFKPVRHITGAPWNGQVQQFLIPSSDSAATFIGDVVKSLGTSGAAGVVVNGQDCEGMLCVTHTTETTTCALMVGVVVGFLPDPTALGTRHRLASTNRIALVVTDPTVVFEVQEDAAATPIASDSVGSAVAIVTTAGNATTGVSSMQIDSSTVDTTATLPFKIVGLVKRPDNALSSGTTDKAKFEVVMNGGVYGAGVTQGV